MNENQSSRRKFIKQASLTTFVAGFSTFPLSASSPNKTSIPKGLKVLFQGDSITDGNRGRTSDPNHIMGHGYAFAASSRIGADFPEAGLQFYNRGISGNKITDLEKRWQADALDIKPDVLSVLVGINDTAAIINKMQRLCLLKISKKHTGEYCTKAGLPTPIFLLYWDCPLYML
jgi:lysophospholipase L1-like esterase